MLKKSKVADELATVITPGTSGIVALVGSATGDRARFDGTGLAVTFIVMGIVLAVTARAADWNTHGPIPQV